MKKNVFMISVMIAKVFCLKKMFHFRHPSASRNSLFAPIAIASSIFFLNIHRQIIAEPNILFVKTSRTVLSIAVQGDTLWIGTNNGVECRDSHGKELEKYTGVSGLAGNYIFDIAIDNRGRKWFSTDNGIGMYDGNSWRTYHTKDGLASNYTRSIAFSSDGSMWVGTERRGVSVVNSGRWSTFDTSNGLAGNFVWEITVDHKGIIWTGTNKGLSRFDGTAWSTFTAPGRFPTNRVRAVAVDSMGYVWCGTDSCACQFDGKEWKFHTVSDGLASNFVSVIEVDRRGNVWCGDGSDNGKGVSVFDGTKWVHFSDTFAGSGSGTVKSIAIGAPGEIWFGTNNGIFRLQQK